MLSYYDYHHIEKESACHKRIKEDCENHTLYIYIYIYIYLVKLDRHFVSLYSLFLFFISIPVFA